MSLIATLISILNGLFTLFGNVSGKKSAPVSDPVTATVEAANAAGRASADITRTTRQTTHEELARVQTDTAADLARLRNADSLPDRQAAIADAIARANADPEADR